MINKLKYVTAYFNRVIEPGAGALEGKIFYTAKNETGRRIQYVTDLDANTTTKQNINAHPEDPLTEPGAVVEITLLEAKADPMYAFGLAGLPVMTSAVQAEFTQTIANLGSITPVNILTGVEIDSVGATAPDVTMSVVAASGLTLNIADGVVTLDDNATPGTYTVDYKIEEVNEPSVYVTGTISVTVNA